ncbi:hypothetical protein BH20ACI3_BH20ACI3_15780 [soil metagenome]
MLRSLVKRLLRQPELCEGSEAQIALLVHFINSPFLDSHFSVFIVYFFIRVPINLTCSLHLGARLDGPLDTQLHAT